MVIAPMPTPMLYVTQGEAGYSLEMSVDWNLSGEQVPVYREACLQMTPEIRVDGPHEIRALASVDEQALWVFAQGSGPGPFGDDQESVVRGLLEEMWQEVHQAAAALGAAERGSGSPRT